MNTFHELLDSICIVLGVLLSWVCNFSPLSEKRTICIRARSHRLDSQAARHGGKCRRCGAPPNAYFLFPFRGGNEWKTKFVILLSSIIAIGDEAGGGDEQKHAPETVTTLHRNLQRNTLVT